MAAKYQTHEGDTTDRICWGYYGRTSGAVEAVLEANRATGLAARGPILPAGLVIDLPDLEAAPAETTISLWD